MTSHVTSGHLHHASHPKSLLWVQGQSGPSPQRGALGVTSPFSWGLSHPLLVPSPAALVHLMSSFLKPEESKAPASSSGFCWSPPPPNFLPLEGGFSVPSTLLRTLALALPLPGCLPYPSSFQTNFLRGFTVTILPKAAWDVLTCCPFGALQSTWWDLDHPCAACTVAWPAPSHARTWAFLCPIPPSSASGPVPAQTMHSRTAMRSRRSSTAREVIQEPANSEPTHGQRLPKSIAPPASADLLAPKPWFPVSCPGFQGSASFLTRPGYPASCPGQRSEAWSSSCRLPLGVRLALAWGHHPWAAATRRGNAWRGGVGRWCGGTGLGVTVHSRREII